MLNTADQLRFYASDKPRMLTEVRYGDGTASAFQLSGASIITGATALGGFQPSAFVPQDNAWGTTGATFNLSLGLVSFNGTISGNSAFQVAYTYATFSDQEIDFVTGAYGDMPSMRLALVDNLMSDYFKRSRWAAQRGAYYDDTEAMKNLMLMRSAIIAERTTELGPLGDIISWDEQQQNY